MGIATNFPCADCRATPNPHIRHVYGAAHFSGAVEQAIKLLKFHGRMCLAGNLGALLVDLVREEVSPEVYDYLVPVPLHKVRERSRGFNQARLLAQAVVPEFPRARLDESLRRIRPTRIQSLLTGAERQANVRGAFAVVGDIYAEKSILLIDDVVTTGGTVTECAHALRKAGAAQVDVLAVALTVSAGFPSNDTPL